MRDAIVHSRGFRKMTVENGVAYRMINHGPLVLVTTMNPSTGRPNVAPVAWCTPVKKTPPLVGLVLGEEHLTTRLARKTGFFTINIPGSALAPECLAAGRSSGTSVDKFAEIGLTPMKGLKVDSPFIEECMGFIECSLKYDYDIDGSTFVVGKVVAAAANENFFVDGRWNLADPRVSTLHHLGGDRFARSSQMDPVEKIDGGLP